jgi:hypothetical protein
MYIFSLLLLILTLDFCHTLTTPGSPERRENHALSSVEDDRVSRSLSSRIVKDYCFTSPTSGVPCEKQQNSSDAKPLNMRTRRGDQRRSMHSVPFAQILVHREQWLRRPLTTVMTNAIQGQAGEVYQIHVQSNTHIAWGGIWDSPDEDALAIFDNPDNPGTFVYQPIEDGHFWVTLKMTFSFSSGDILVTLLA